MNITWLQLFGLVLFSAHVYGRYRIVATRLLTIAHIHHNHIKIDVCEPFHWSQPRAELWTGWHVDLVTAHKPHFEIVETLLLYYTVLHICMYYVRRATVQWPRPLFVSLYSGWQRRDHCLSFSAKTRRAHAACPAPRQNKIHQSTI